MCRLCGLVPNARLVQGTLVWFWKLRGFLEDSVTLGPSRVLTRSAQRFAWPGVAGVLERSGVWGFVRTVDQLVRPYLRVPSGACTRGFGKVCWGIRLWKVSKCCGRIKPSSKRLGSWSLACVKSTWSCSQRICVNCCRFHILIILRVEWREENSGSNSFKGGRM